MTGSSKESTEPAWEFHDIINDPKEDYNVYNDPAYTDIIGEMKVELIHQRNLVGDNDSKYPVMHEIFKKHWNND